MLVNYGKEFIIQYNDLTLRGVQGTLKNSNGKIGEKKAKGIIYDKILEHLTIIQSKEMGLQLPEISCKTLCRKTQRAIKTYKLCGVPQVQKLHFRSQISDLRPQ